MLFLCYLAVTANQSKIAFVKNEKLYVLACDSKGLPAINAKPIYICKLWKKYSDFTKIQWTPSGMIAVEHYVDAWNGPKRFGLSADKPVSGIWLVEPKAGAKMRQIETGHNPSFSPDGSEMSFQVDSIDSDIFVINLHSLVRRKVASNASCFIWSRSGKKVAYVQAKDRNEISGEATIRSYPGWSLMKSIPPGAPTVGLMFSPSDAEFAVQEHLSRPKLGHVLTDLVSGKELHIQCPPEYAPPIITDWSPDGKSMMCSWRVIDPKNDGAWIREYVGLAPLRGGKAKRLVEGASGRFSADGKHALFVVNRRRGKSWNTGDLSWTPLNGKSQRVLVSNVDQFEMFRGSS